LKTTKQDQGRTFWTRKPMEALLNMQVSRTRNFCVLWQTKKGNCCLWSPNPFPGPSSMGGLTFLLGPRENIIFFHLFGFIKPVENSSYLKWWVYNNYYYCQAKVPCQLRRQQWTSKYLNNKSSKAEKKEPRKTEVHILKTTPSISNDTNLYTVFS